MYSWALRVVLGEGREGFSQSRDHSNWLLASLFPLLFPTRREWKSPILGLLSASPSVRFPRNNVKITMFLGKFSTHRQHISAVKQMNNESKPRGAARCSFNHCQDHAVAPSHSCTARGRMTPRARIPARAICEERDGQNSSVQPQRILCTASPKCPQCTS